MSLRTFVVAALTVAPLLALADEGQAFCDLTRERAHARAALLGSAEAFVTSAPESGSSGQELLAGVRKSLAGVRKAGIVADLATAECAAYRSNLATSLALSGLDAQAERTAQLARKPVLEQAARLAEEHLSVEQDLMGRQLATWADIRSAADLRDRARAELYRVEQALARTSNVPAYHPRALRRTVEESVRAKAEGVRLSAALEAASGWDLSLTLGSRRGLSSGALSTFVGVTYSYSFGHSEASASARRAGVLAANLLRQEHSGVAQQFERKLTEVKGARDTSLIAQRNQVERLELVDSALQRIGEVKSSTAERMRRSLGVERLLVKSELVATEAYAGLLDSWLREQQDESAK